MSGRMAYVMNLPFVLINFRIYIAFDWQDEMQDVLTPIEASECSIIKCVIGCGRCISGDSLLVVEHTADMFPVFVL